MKRWVWLLIVCGLFWAGLGVAQNVEPFFILTGHTDSVRFIGFSPDGRLLISVSEDCIIKLWDMATGRLVRNLTGPTDWVYRVALSPDGTLLAFGYGTIWLWDVATGKEVHILNDQRGAQGAMCLVFSPDGRLLALGFPNCTIKLWDVVTGMLIHNLRDHTDTVWSVAFSPDGRTLASGSDDNTIKLWDATSGSILRTLTGHTSGIDSVAFSPDGRTLASGSDDNTIKLWDATSGSILRTLTGHTSRIDSVAFSPDGRTLASGSVDNTIKLWDVATGTLVHNLRGHTDRVYSVAFSPDGTLLASISGDKTIKLWDATSGSILHTLTGHTSWVNSVAFSPDGTLLASGSRDGTVLLWDVDAILHPNEPPTATFTWQALSASGTRLVVEPRTGDSIQFDASASSDPDGEIVEYAWDWTSNGDFDAMSNEPVAEHSFDTSSTHRVTLRVTDDGGLTAEVTETVTIGERVPPVAGFDMSPAEPSFLDDVSFTDTSTDPDGQVVSRHWDFGDGSTSTAPNPTHQYTEKKTFTVTLIVTDNDDLIDTKTASITVVNIPPESSFTFSPERPYINQPIAFDASASTDKDGTITGYAWDFDDDGKEDIHGETSWTFTETGTVTVTLTVTDDDGDTAFHQEEITVKDTPPGPPRFEDLWAVVIGVGEYEDSRLDLGLPEDDAQAVYDFLVDTQGGGFPKDHVRLLVNEDATKKGIEQAWGWLLRQAGKDDLVLVYFSGHGGHDHDYNGDEPEGDTEDEYLLPYDTDPSDFFSTAVRDDAVGDWVSSLRSEHVILIFDSCHSGGAAKTVKAYETPGSRAGPGNTVFTDLMGVDGVLVMTACQATELAQQDDNLGYGVFTYFLLAGLGGLENVGAPAADIDQDGRVTVEELKSYLQREVPQYVSDVMHAASPQNPLITGDDALSRVALSGYGVPLVGEVTAIDQERVIITLGSRHGLQPGDRFEVVHILQFPDGQTMEEHRAIIEVLYVLGLNRSVCSVVETIYPIELRDQVRPVEE